VPVRVPIETGQNLLTDPGYVFPKTWPTDREQRARIIGEWLQTEARFLT